MTENQVSRRNFLKKAVPVIAGVGLAGALGIDRTFGSLTTTSTVSGTGPSTTPGTPLATASYVIAQERNFEAQNGTTGKIDFSGTDATQVIQSAINALPNGGLIFIRKGIYTTTSPIILSQGIHLLGEQGAILRVEDGAQTSTNPFNIVEVKGDNVTIENLELDGNAPSNPNFAGNTLDPAPANPDMQSGVMVRSGQNPEIQNCYIHDTWNAGIWLAASNGDVQGSEIASCLIESTGLSYSDPTSANPPQSANAVYVYGSPGSTSHTNIHDNIVKDTFGRGIYHHFDSESTVTNNAISSSLSPSTETAGILVDDGSSRIILRGNQISGYGPSILIVWAGCDDIIVEANSCFDAPNCGGSGSGILINSSAPAGPALRNVIVKGNICSGNALPGINLSGLQALVYGNICYNNNTDSKDLPTRKSGILVQTGGFPETSGISLMGNRCFDNQDMPTQLYGISISEMGGTISNVLITDNDLRGNAVGAIGELSSSSSRVTGNLGYNPRGVAPVDVGASPFTYTNRDSVPETIYLEGGLVTQVSKNGIEIFTSTPATILLEPDDSIEIVHSDPPKMLKDQH